MDDTTITLEFRKNCDGEYYTTTPQLGANHGKITYVSKFYDMYELDDAIIDAILNYRIYHTGNHPQLVSITIDNYNDRINFYNELFEMINCSNFSDRIKFVNGIYVLFKVKYGDDYYDYYYDIKQLISYIFELKYDNIPTNSIEFEQQLLSNIDTLVKKTSNISDKPFEKTRTIWSKCFIEYNENNKRYKTKTIWSMCFIEYNENNKPKIPYFVTNLNIEYKIDSHVTMADDDELYIAAKKISVNLDKYQIYQNILKTLSIWLFHNHRESLQCYDNHRKNDCRIIIPNNIINFSKNCKIMIGRHNVLREPQTQNKFVICVNKFTFNKMKFTDFGNYYVKIYKDLTILNLIIKCKRFKQYTKLINLMHLLYLNDLPRELIYIFLYMIYENIAKR